MKKLIGLVLLAFFMVGYPSQTQAQSKSDVSTASKLNKRKKAKRKDARKGKKAYSKGVKKHWKSQKGLTRRERNKLRKQHKATHRNRRPLFRPR